MKIGLVDDDRAVLRALTRLLSAYDHRVAAYESAKEFLQHAPLATFDCILVDMWMPELNGFQLFDQLIRTGCKAPIIFITAHGDAVTREEAARRGATMIIKPFDDTTLLAAINEAVASVRPDAGRTPPEIVPPE
jgi:FixJ family two-component response regulator